MSTIVTSLFLIAITASQCVRAPDGDWSCPDVSAAPFAQPTQSAGSSAARRSLARPTAMDVRVECRTSRGSGTSVARLARNRTAIVTNHHVVAGQSRITLVAGDGQTATGTLLAVDKPNDLALIAVEAAWPVVALGDRVHAGLAVQFRAFDRGERFRKYYGNVTGEYRTRSNFQGWFATGQSVGGNSGGGVYSRGKLVGVIWGAPRGQTAFVPVDFVRRLIARVKSTSPVSIVQRPSLVEPPPRSNRDTPASGCDCDARFAQIEQRLQSQTPEGPAIRPGKSPSLVRPAISWGKLLAGALGISGPVGVGIALAGLFVSRKWRRQRDLGHSERGPGGPRNQRFRE